MKNRVRDLRGKNHPLPAPANAAVTRRATGMQRSLPVLQPTALRIAG